MDFDGFDMDLITSEMTLEAQADAISFHSANLTQTTNEGHHALLDAMTEDSFDDALLYNNDSDTSKTDVAFNWGWGGENEPEDEIVVTGVRTLSGAGVIFDMLAYNALIEYFSQTFDNLSLFGAGAGEDSSEQEEEHECPNSSSNAQELEQEIDGAANAVADEINQLDQSLEHGSVLAQDPNTGEIIALPIVTGTNNLVPVTDAQAAQYGLTESLEGTLHDAGYGWENVVGVVHSHPPETSVGLPGDTGHGQYIADTNLRNNLPSTNDAGLESWITSETGGGVTADGFADRFSMYIVGTDDALREFENPSEFSNLGLVTDANRQSLEDAATQGEQEAVAVSCENGD